MNILRALFSDPKGQELLEAMVDDSPPTGTHGEMAEKLGLGREPDVVEYYNALINVQSNSNVKSMSRDERVKTIAQAVAALGDLEDRRQTGR